MTKPLGKEHSRLWREQTCSPISLDLTTTAFFSENSSKSFCLFVCFENQIGKREQHKFNIFRFNYRKVHRNFAPTFAIWKGFIISLHGCICQDLRRNWTERIHSSFCGDWKSRIHGVSQTGLKLKQGFYIIVLSLNSFCCQENSVFPLRALNWLDEAYPHYGG